MKSEYVTLEFDLMRSIGMAILYLVSWAISWALAYVYIDIWIFSLATPSLEDQDFYRLLLKGEPIQRSIEHVLPNIMAFEWGIGGVLFLIISIFLGILVFGVAFIVYFAPTILANNVNLPQPIKPLDMLWRVFAKHIMVPIIHLWVLYRLRRGKVVRFKDVDSSFLNDDFEFQRAYLLDRVLEETPNEEGGGWRSDVFGNSEPVRHPQLVWIFLINLLLAPTLVFWIVAFFWALSPGKVKVPEGQYIITD